MQTKLEEPKTRSALRLKLGRAYYGAQRKLLWLKMNQQFARTRQNDTLPYAYASHKTILMRKLKDVDMWMQKNKIINLKLAVHVPARLQSQFALSHHSGCPFRLP